MTTLLHVDADDLLVDSFKLGRAVFESGFRPRHVISIWRGGTPVGLGVDAYFRSQGLAINHTTIATDSYVGIGRQGEVTVKNLEHLVQVICPEDALLIVDDVYESGNTIRRVVELLRQKARANAPRDILIATVHDKPEKRVYDDLPVIALKQIAADVWIDYPHELSDLVDPADTDDRKIFEKDPDLWRVLRGEAGNQDTFGGMDHLPYIYVQPRDLLLDCMKLGVIVSNDAGFSPDFIVALWPGRVLSGLPVHEVYKYYLAKRRSHRRPPDHISINTTPTRLSYRSQVLGIRYLEDHVEKTDQLLIIDTTFRAGRLVNDVISRLKETLRRNLNHKQVRVASVYYNPDDDSTWTVTPDIRKPHYFLHEVHKEIIYPASIHKLPNPRKDLLVLNPRLHRVLYGD